MFLHCKQILYYLSHYRKPNNCILTYIHRHAQPCPTLWPMACSLPVSSVHGILQVRILDWVNVSSSQGSSWPRDQTCVSCVSGIGKQILYHWATWEAQYVLICACKHTLSFRFCMSPLERKDWVTHSQWINYGKERIQWWNLVDVILTKWSTSTLPGIMWY